MGHQFSIFFSGLVYTYTGKHQPAIITTVYCDDKNHHIWLNFAYTQVISLSQVRLINTLSWPISRVPKVSKVSRPRIGAYLTRVRCWWRFNQPESMSPKLQPFNHQEKTIVRWLNHHCLINQVFRVLPNYGYFHQCWFFSQELCRRQRRPGRLDLSDSQKEMGDVKPLQAISPNSIVWGASLLKGLRFI